MSPNEERWRPDFELAMGQSFSECVKFEDGSPHECCEAIWAVLGMNVTPRDLAALSDERIEALALSFGKYFELEAPSAEQMKEAVARTLARWPVGSLGE